MSSKAPSFTVKSQDGTEITLIPCGSAPLHEGKMLRPNMTPILTAPVFSLDVRADLGAQSVDRTSDGQPED